MPVPQPAFFGVTGNQGASGTLTLAPISGLVAGDFLLLITCSYNASAWVAPTVSASWSANVLSPGALVAGLASSMVWSRKWTGSELASFWQIAVQGADPTVAVVVAYRGCDASAQCFVVNTPANNTATGATGQMVTNTVPNFLLAANAGTVVLFGISNGTARVSACTPPATSQTGAYTQRAYLENSISSNNSSALIWVGDSLTTPAGVASLTTPNGNGGWTSTGNVSTAMLALFLIPPTISNVGFKYPTNAQNIASGLPGAVAWSNVGNVFADDDVRANNSQVNRADTDWIRTNVYSLNVPAGASFLGFGFRTALRAYVPTTATNPSSWDLSYALTKPADGSLDSTTLQSHVQNFAGTKISGSATPSSPPDGVMNYGGILYWAGAYTVAQVNSANMGYALLATLVNDDPAGAYTSVMEVDSMQLNAWYWHDITAPTTAAVPLLACEA